MNRRRRKRPRFKIDDDGRIVDLSRYPVPRRHKSTRRKFKWADWHEQEELGLAWATAGADLARMARNYFEGKVSLPELIDTAFEYGRTPVPVQCHPRLLDLFDFDSQLLGAAIELTWRADEPAGRRFIQEARAWASRDDRRDFDWTSRH